MCGRLLFGGGTSVAFAAGDGGCDFLLLAGVPLREPVVWHGPFVMNTQDEVLAAVRAYQAGRLTA